MKANRGAGGLAGATGPSRLSARPNPDTSEQTLTAQGSGEALGQELGAGVRQSYVQPGLAL